MSFYLLEIGCEELPAAFVPLAAGYLKEQAQKELEQLHLEYSEIKSNGTPRRIYLYINGLPSRQNDRKDVVQGPPARIAFNTDGSVSEVGKKFVESKGLDLATVTKTQTDKGEYLTAEKNIIGQNSNILIAEMVSNLIKSIPFPKSMKWSDRDMRFGRPLKYLLSIWDGSVLDLDLEGFKASNTTVGHHFLAYDPIVVKNFEEYTSAMAKSFVILNEEDRIAEIKKQFAELSAKSGYQVDTDENLLKTVANLVEYPYAVEGNFDEEFLQLPSQVLITSMKVHQKYFPTYKNDKLLSSFIGVANIKPDDVTFIRQGYQRVLRARLNDAMFFYNNDRNYPLKDRVDALKKVVYQEKLGTYYEKMLRFKALAQFIAKTVSPASVAVVEEASILAKADLMCEMVYEFPELQGIAGSIYAKLQGYPDAVSTAIVEHYMPRFATDDLPSSDAGRIVAIADKMDTLAGAFSIGMIPTGNVDPYGLRRNAIGILNILESAGWRISLQDLTDKTLELLSEKATQNIAETKDKILSFIMQRQKQIYISKNIDADAFDAASVIFTDVISLRDRAAALTEAKKASSFVSIAAGFKRINNILKKNPAKTTDINQTLLQQEEEKALFNKYNEKNTTILSHIKNENWKQAIEELSTFAEPLNNFFDNVMVMAEDANLRNNRLALLASLYGLFTTVGDLSEII